MAEWRSLGLDFVTLRVFKAAVEEQSFIGAAEREHLAASAISRRIAEMEARLGIELLRRHDRGVEPTQAGRVLMRHLESLFDIVAVTLSDLESLTQGKTGEVRLVASISMITSIFPKLLGQIRSCHPDLDLRLEQGNSEDILVSLNRGTADIGFVSGVAAPEDMTSYEFLVEPLEVVLSPAHPLATRGAGLAFADLDRCDYVALRDNLALQHLISRKAVGTGVELRTTVVVDGFDSLAKYVDVGMGIAIMPKFHADAARATYDVALCMYHDQALIPAKALGFDDSVNATLGLPFIRTSPDHGTAFAIAGKGEARPDSMIAAIRMAGEAVANRKAFAAAACLA